MCGIAGYFTRGTLPVHAAEQMADALAARGPDARHCLRWAPGWRRTEGESNAALIHARLSIIDPRPEANQPMTCEAGDVWICYNGEVYGWEQDAEELKSHGAVFRTRSDTEFILHAWRRWGIDMLPRLRGMFAIAILDLRSQKLWLIRDRMGLKPVVHAQGAWGFAFGSTVRSVLPALPQRERGWDPLSVDAYLAHRYIPAPRTIFAGVRRLPNAHWLCHDLQTGHTQVQRYWAPPLLPETTPHGTAEILKTLDEAVRLRTVADRPLGVFLSSGIDSSCVAARLAAMGHSQMHSFTAGFYDPAMDESPIAAGIAQTLGFKHTILSMPRAIAPEIDRIIADLDEPFADPSAIPTWCLARETTKHVKVVLGGDGGDEMLAGYKRLPKHLRSAWRRNLCLPLRRPGARPDLANGRWARVLDELSMDWLHAYSLRFSGLSPGQRAALQPDFTAAEPVYWREIHASSQLPPLLRLLEVDRENYLPEYILRKGDLCTMSHGLELRAPLLDHHWVSLVYRLPAAQRFTRPTKQLLRPGMQALEQHNLFEAKKKGFNPPLRTWLEEDLRPRLETMPQQLQALTEGQVSAAAAKELLALYQGGSHRHAEQVLQLLFLQISLDQLSVLRRQP